MMQNFIQGRQAAVSSTTHAFGGLLVVITLQAEMLK